LGRQLGSKAIATSVTIDLETAFPGFIQAHFPTLAQLNQQLNTPAGERVEHNATRLTYRYPKRNKYPFDFVSLVFSNYTLKSMVFKIVASQEDGASLVDTLKTKYGDPEIFTWEKGQSYIWEKSDELMIASAIRNRSGDQKYYIVIYYLDNISDLISREAAARTVPVNQKPAQSAF
jgi:hypothetical protein